MTRSLKDSVRDLLASARSAYDGTDIATGIDVIARRLDEPLRVAIAGKVKAGKSTLLNALVGEELAPTGAQETTKIVTWYVDGPTYRVTLHSRAGASRQVPFHKNGAVEVDLGDTAAVDVDHLVVEWPSATLRRMSLIDTPGLASLTREVSDRTVELLVPGDELVSPVDAVLYLLRHLHTTDTEFLEAFHGDGSAQATPINAVGVLSRADEVAPGRIDAMSSAARISARYRVDERIRRLCYTVLPVAGLLAQAGATLREGEFAAIQRLAAADRVHLDELLLSADRFVNVPTPVGLTTLERAHLLERLGLFGVHVAAALVGAGTARSASQLANELLARSGLVELRQALVSQFADRADLLKVRSALLSLDQLLAAHPVAGRDAVASELERITASAHELAEVRLLNSVRAGSVPLRGEEVEALERILGGAGSSPAARLGLPADADVMSLRASANEMLERWRRRAENPLSTRPVVDACRVAVRTCEGMIAALADRSSSPTP